MYLTSHLKTVFIIACFFIANTTKAQSTQPDTLSKFTGTWLGATLPPLDGKDIKRLSYIIWRIHHIDNSKNQIELTEIGERFESAIEVKKPMKMNYKGYADGDSLFVDLNNHVTKGKFTFKMKLEKEEGGTLLRGFVQKNDGNKDSLPFYLIKVSDDTSTYIKPIKAVEVIVMPPPPEN